MNCNIFVNDKNEILNYFKCKLWHKGIYYFCFKGRWLFLILFNLKAEYNSVTIKL